MRFVSPYHAGARIQKGRGISQRGAGLGSLFRALLRSLKPLAAKGVQMAKEALANPAVKTAVKDIKDSAIKSGTQAVKDLQSSAIKSGVKAINKVLNPGGEKKEGGEKKPSKKRKKKSQQAAAAAETAEPPPPPAKKKKKGRARTIITKPGAIY